MRRIKSETIWPCAKTVQVQTGRHKHFQENCNFFFVLSFSVSIFIDSIRFGEIQFLSLSIILHLYISTFNLTKHIHKMAHMRTTAFSMYLFISFALHIYSYIHYMRKSFSIRLDANLFSQSGNIHSNIFITNVVALVHSATISPT